MPSKYEDEQRFLRVQALRLEVKAALESMLTEVDDVNNIITLSSMKTRALAVKGGVKRTREKLDEKKIKSREYYANNKERLSQQKKSRKKGASEVVGPEK